MLDHVSFPDKASEFLEDALSDLEKIEKDKRYNIRMSQWHMPKRLVEKDLGFDYADTIYKDKEICSVCLAGCYLAKTLNFPIGKHIDVGYNNNAETYEKNILSNRVRAKLRALDYLRKGSISTGLNIFYGKFVIDHYEPRVNITPYHRDKNKFKQDMKSLIQLLKDKGY